MTQRESVLPWPAEATAPASAHPRVERFKGGGKKTVLLLGNPLKKQIHWNGDLKVSVPCFRPAFCPFCNEPKFTCSGREEGFAPGMVLNFRQRQWEQAVVVFTRGALVQLDDFKRRAATDSVRGWVIEVSKASQSGRTSPMQLKQLESVSDDFPLPQEFSARAVMLRVWFPNVEHEEPIDWIEPIKISRRRQQSDSTPTMELDAEKAAMLAATLRKNGLSHFADLVTTAATGHHEDPQKKPGELATIETAADPANYGPKVPVQTPPSADTSEQALTKGTGAIIAGEQKAKRPGMLDAAKRRADAAARTNGERLTTAGALLDNLIPTEATNGKHAEAEKGGAK